MPTDKKILANHLSDALSGLASGPVQQKFFLRIVGAGRSRQRFELRSEARIGRHPENDLQILDAGISKFHARIWQEPDGVIWIEDLGSQNGTRLNHHDLLQARRIFPGDALTLGDTHIELQEEHNFVGQGASLSLQPTIVSQPTQVLASLTLKEERFPGAENFSHPEDFSLAYEQLRSSYALLHAVASAEDLTVLSQAIVDAMLKHLHFSCGALMLLDNEDQAGESWLPRLAPLAVRGLEGHEQLNMEIPEDILSRVAAERNALLSYNLGLSSLTAPLVVTGQVLGLLHLVTREVRPALSAGDLSWLATVTKPAALAIANARLMQRVNDDAQNLQSLERFLSPTLVAQVRRGELLLHQRGQIKNATILFADIRGFVRLTQGFEAVAVVDMLNQYFERAVEVIFRYQGMLDKYIGDAVMAVWGVTNSGTGHQVQALSAAFALREALVELNLERQRRGEARIQIGIGLASGDVVAGFVGGRQRQEYTVVGDAVNLASRLCAMAGAGQILLPGQMQAHAEKLFSWRDLGAQMVKGKTSPMRILEFAPQGGLVQG